MDMSSMSSMDMAPTSTMMSMSPSSTMSGMDMSTSSSVTSSMDSSMSGMTMDMSQMNMVFFTSHTTPLFSSAWTPNTVGQYAGTCIFLIVLSFLLRLMYGIKCRTEARWQDQNLKRRYIVTQAASRTANDGSRDSDEESDIDQAYLRGVDLKDASKGVLTVNGVTEQVKIVQSAKVHGAQPLRVSVDLTRACFVTVMVGVGYLLMLAVMTMNVGYFLSVLAGAFLGELSFGRWSTHHVEEHH